MSSCAPSDGSVTVLVVEDNPGDARLVELALLAGFDDSFRILKAARLDVALEAMAAQRVDVALLDLNLPDSHGLRTLETVRAAHPFLPVVVLTGSADRDLALSSLRQGAQDYLVKGEGDGEVLRRSVHYAIERSRVDHALRESEARFRALFEKAPLGVLLSAPDGQVVEANPAFCAMLGRSSDALKDMGILDFTHPDDLALSAEVFSDLAAGRRDGYQVTKRYLTGDGGFIWARVTASAICDPGDDGVRYNVAVIEDVTERKRLEDYMRLATTVFESTGEGLFVTDADQRIIHVNPAFSEITGFSSEDVLGRTPKVLSSGRHDRDFYERMWQAILRDGKWQGEIWNRRKSGEFFAEWLSISMVRDPGGTVRNYVAVFNDITLRKQVEERLSYQANHDPLTRLPNRTLFHERLSRALARAQRNHAMVALLFVDLDRFKQVNDTLGHLAGDILLQQVAERLTACTRQGDTVARLAGDEFTVILEDIDDARDAAVVAHKILRLLAETFDLGGSPAEISGSVGVSLYPADAGEAEGLIKLADEAMYRAKHQGRNAVQFHSETINTQAFERLALENALRIGLAEGQLRLHYQPIYDLKTGALCALEALVRWQHPEIGLLAPGQFLPLADQTGLIGAIGKWVADTACACLAQWRRMAGAEALVVNINLSGRQMRDAGLVEGIAAALVAAGLGGEALTVEIPESCVLDPGQDASGVLAQLKALGVKVLIEGFGSGNSSFSVLRRLNAHALKVDMGLIRQLTPGGDEAEIVAALQALARGLHMQVVTPGIETQAQLSLLRQMGSDRGQGYLLSRPLDEDAVTAVLRQGATCPVLQSSLLSEGGA